MNEKLILPLVLSVTDNKDASTQMITIEFLSRPCTEVDIFQILWLINVFQYFRLLGIISTTKNTNNV